MSVIPFDEREGTIWFDGKIESSEPMRTFARTSALVAWSIPMTRAVVSAARAVALTRAR